ncbi:hypothetical protein BCV70DRAFT_165509 [Testicularia cyperi]|uniref:DUF833-domain-containing protein n=1 Tax=Testicularia cyperi TaxID=1882483 RepID=A0A317XIU0_9BASI|nr:hypothetical protein BCV70DRAFT_165509 [Testicularia cyperi]
MCVIFWTTSDPNFDLVVASNRDEFLARPTIPAGWHSFSTASNHTGESGPSEQHDEPGGPILSARDASGGGTWLGITQNGSFATLTNFTEATPPLPDHLKAFESRGRLVRDWLEQQARREKQAQQQPPRTVQQAASDVTAYLESLAGKLDHFPGFNLLVGTLSQQGGVVGYMTNRTPDGKVCVDRSPDLFLPSQKTSASTTAASAEKPKADQQAEATGRMSNSVLSEPWNKVTTGSALFQAALDRYSINTTERQQELIESLFDLLWTPPPAPIRERSDLRNSILVTPIPLPSPSAPPSSSTPQSGQGAKWYATRTSTVILIPKSNREFGSKGGPAHAVFVERDTYGLDTGARGTESKDGTSAGADTHGSQRLFKWHLQ